MSSRPAHIALLMPWRADIRLQDAPLEPRGSYELGPRLEGVNLRLTPEGHVWEVVR